MHQWDTDPKHEFDLRPLLLGGLIIAALVAFTVAIIVT